MGVIDKLTGHQLGSPLGGSSNPTGYFSKLYVGDSSRDSLLEPSSVVQHAKVTLTAAQVKALNTTPITLVAAPGAGFVVDVIDILAYLNFATTQFTGANAVEFRYTNGSGAKVAGDAASAWLDGGSSAAVKTVAAAVTPVVNAAVVASVPTANPAAGDSTVTIEVAYRNVKLP